MTRLPRILALLALGVAPMARGEVFLRESIPDLFDLGASRGARLALTAPDSGPNSYSVDAALGFWTDFIEFSPDPRVGTSGVAGLVGELHRTSAGRSPVNSRRVTASGWTLVALGDYFLPTSEGIGWQKDIIHDTAVWQAYAKTSLVLPKKPGTQELSLLHALLWSTSYAPLGFLLAAGSPSIGMNYQSANAGASGDVMSGRAEYAASIKGASGLLAKLSLDLSWLYQRRIDGKGSLALGPRDHRRIRVGLAYQLSDSAAIVAERIDGDDPFDGTGHQELTTLSLRVRFGKGPPSGP